MILSGEQIMKMYIFNCDCNICSGKENKQNVNKENVNKQNVNKENQTNKRKNIIKLEDIIENSKLPIKKRKFCFIN